MKSLKKISDLSKSQVTVSSTLKRNPNHAAFFDKKAQEAANFLKKIDLKF
jgi:hypothetical protein